MLYEQIQSKLPPLTYRLTVILIQKRKTYSNKLTQLEIEPKVSELEVIMLQENVEFRHTKKKTKYYSATHRIIIVLKDTASYSIAKRIAPSLSLLRGSSLKIRKRPT